jgi:hypothetical protein
VHSLAAIDVHVHAEVSSSGSASLPGQLEQASNAYFKITDTHRLTEVLPAAAGAVRQLRCCRTR